MVGGYLKFNKQEKGPGTLDAIVIYFDSDKADYKSYDCGSTGLISLRSGQYAKSGTLVFNFDDSKIKLDTFYTAMAVIKPTAAKGTNILFGIDYRHSYSTVSTVPSGGSIGMSFGGSGLVGGSVGVNFSVSIKEHEYDQGDTASFVVK